MNAAYHWIGFVVFWVICAYIAVGAWWKFVYDPNRDWFGQKRRIIQDAWHLAFRRGKIESKIQSWVKRNSLQMAVHQLRMVLSKRHRWAYRKMLRMAISAINNEFGLDKIEGK